MDTSDHSWTQQAVANLLESKGADGWGYRPRTESYVEPSVIAALALQVTADPTAATRSAVAQVQEWLVTVQNRDGSLGLSGSLREPWWPTAHAALLWGTDQQFSEPCQRAIEWLLLAKGMAYTKPPDDPIAHDTALVGWPWVAGTHSWLEPTVMALLALYKYGENEAQRVADGLRLLRDRATPTGGWNYGNSGAFGIALRPHPATTGLALLALAAAGQKSDVVTRALAYLQETLPTVRSGESLCWGLLGLRAWGIVPDGASTWLAEAYGKMTKRTDQIMPRAQLLLAASPQALAPLGVKT